MIARYENRSPRMEVKLDHIENLSMQASERKQYFENKNLN